MSPTHEAQALRRRQRRGYTLIEVLVAISVIAIGLLGIFQVLTSTILTNADSRNRSFATHFAEQKLEAMRSMQYSQITAVPATADPVLQALSPNATWSQTVQNWGTIMTVTVTVQWTHQGRPQTVRLDTVVSRDGINSIR